MLEPTLKHTQHNAISMQHTLSPETEAMQTRAGELRKKVRSLAELIGVGFDHNSFSNIKAAINGEMMEIMTILIEGKSSPIFQKFFDENGKLNEEKIRKKIEVYLSIHKRPLIDYALDIFKNDTKLKNIDPEETEKIKSRKQKIIKNILFKYMRVILTFGEKIPPDNIASLLEGDGNSLASIEKNYSRRLSLLEESEEEHGSININTPRILSNALKEMISQQGNAQKIKRANAENVLEVVKNSTEEELVKLIQSALIYDFRMFSYILEDEVNFINPDTKQLSPNIIFLQQQILNSKEIIAIFRENGFELNALKSIELGKKPKEDTNEILEAIRLVEDLEKDTRDTEFFRENKRELFERYVEIFEDTEEERYFWEALAEHKKIEKRGSIPKPLDDVDLSQYDTKTLTINEWMDTPEGQKYDFIFQKVFSKDAEHLSIDREALEIDAIETYAEVFITTLFSSEKNPLSEKQIKKYAKIFQNQMIEIQNFSDAGNIKIYDLITEKENDMNILIAWWRFILKKHQLEKNEEEISQENIQKLLKQEVSYGALEKILKKLSIQNDKVDVKTKRSINTSVRDMQKISQEKQNALTRGNIRISDKDMYRIDSVNGENLEFAIKDITDIYIPREVYMLSQEEESDLVFREKQIQHIDAWIFTGIQTCRRLLSGKEICENGQKKYLKMLQEYGIANANGKIRDNEAYRVHMFIDKLKFIKAKARDLEEMFQTNDEDLDTIRDILDFNTKSKEVKVRPQKSFVRAFEKFVKDHSVNGNRITDLGGGMCAQESIGDTIQAVVDLVQYLSNHEKVSHISIIDKISEPLAFAKKASGYRDIKLLVTLESGNTIEIQFHLKSMLDMKKNGPSKNELIRATNELKGENMLLSKEEMEEMIYFARITNRTLPHYEILDMLLSQGRTAHIPGVLAYDIFAKELNTPEDHIQDFSLDAIYNIVRSVKKENPSLAQKLNRLHRALADIAFGPMAADYALKKIHK